MATSSKLTRRRDNRARAWWMRHQGRLSPYIFIAPNMVIFAVFLFFPILFAFYISFNEWSLIGTPQFVGLENYVNMVQDSRFWRSLYNTVVYTVGTVPTSMALGLAVAVLLNRRLMARTLLRSFYFLPVIISGVAVALLGSWIFDENYGVLNGLLERIGIGSLPWLTSPKLAMLSLIIVTLWVRLGFCMVIYLASLQSIPKEYYDAAKVDGATGWRQFWHITWPLLGPTTYLLIVINVIFSFHVFDVIYVMTGGGPGFSTTVLVQYIYQEAFQTSQMGYASAMGIALYLIILVFSILQWRIGRQEESVQ